MKKILSILTLSLFLCTSLKAQEEDETADKIRDRMREYIQKRLALTKSESEKFTPVFVRYFREWRTTLRENQGPKLDRLELQKKIIDLRIRYRPEFKEILGDRRSNEVFDHQDRFVKELQTLRQERLQNRRGGGGPRTRMMVRENQRVL